MSTISELFGQLSMCLIRVEEARKRIDRTCELPLEAAVESELLAVLRELGELHEDILAVNRLAYRLDDEQMVDLRSSMMIRADH